MDACNVSQDSKFVSKISHEDFQIGTQIGESRFGNIFNAIEKRSGDSYSLQISSLTSDCDLKYVFESFKVCSKLSHRNIAKYLNVGIDTGNHSKDELFSVIDSLMIYENGSIYKPKSLLIQMNECMQSLSDYLNEFGGVNEDTRIDIMKQIVKGFSYLNKKGINQLDFDPKSILFDNNYDVKLTYFAQNKTTNNLDPNQKSDNTKHELHVKESIYNLGTTWLRLCVYPDKENELFKNSIAEFHNGTVPEAASELMTTEESVLLSKILIKDAKRRYSLSTVEQYMKDKLPNPDGTYGLKISRNKNEESEFEYVESTAVEEVVFAHQSNEHRNKNDETSQSETEEKSSKGVVETGPLLYGSNKQLVENQATTNIIGEWPYSNGDYFENQSHNTGIRQTDARFNTDLEHNSKFNQLYKYDANFVDVMGLCMLEKHVESRDDAYEAGAADVHNRAQYPVNEKRRENIERRYKELNYGDDNQRLPNESEADAVRRRLYTNYGVTKMRAYEQGLDLARSKARHEEYLREIEEEKRQINESPNPGNLIKSAVKSVWNSLTRQNPK